MDFESAMDAAEREDIINNWTAGAQFLVMAAAQYSNTKTTKSFRLLRDIMNNFAEVDRQASEAGIEIPMDHLTKRNQALIAIVRELDTSDQDAFAKAFDRFEGVLTQFAAKR